MIGTWIMFWVFTLYPGSITSGSQEFSTKGKCNAAKNHLLEKVNGKTLGVGAYCFKK